MEQVIRSKPKLGILPGRRFPEVSFGTLKIAASEETQAPFRVDAVAEEEDTYLVLSEELYGVVREENPLRVLTSAFTVRPVPPGSVLVRRGAPLRFLAIVHDLDRVPSWEEEWVAEALEAIFREAEKGGVHSLGLPPLGIRHGTMELHRFLSLLRQVLEGRRFVSLERLWIMLPWKMATKSVFMLLWEQFREVPKSSWLR